MLTVSALLIVLAFVLACVDRVKYAVMALCVAELLLHVPLALK